MIKKYFALSIIALSVAMVGCSSDDDDDDPVAGGTTAGTTTDGATTAGATTDGTTTAGSTTDGATTDGGTTDGATTDGGGAAVELTAEATVPEVSAYDFVASSTDHTTLLAALDANPAIANAADDDAAPITLIAPNNAAFDALVAATDGSDSAEDLLANEGELVTRTLQYHAIGSVVDITDTTPATDTLLVDDGTAAQLTFQAGTSETAAAVDSGTNAVDLAVVSESATGNLYSVASVLVAPEAPVEAGGTTDGGTTDGGTTDGGGTTPPPAGDHVGAGNTVADAFAAQLSAQYTGTNVDDGSTNTTDLWAFFIPADAATDGTTIDFAFLQSHVDTDTGSTRTFDLTGFPDGGSILVNGGQTYQITNDGTTITVGGATITQLGTSPQGGFIYAADAILVP